MTTTATEEAPAQAPAAAIPLNSLRALAAWREHREALTFAERVRAPTKAEKAAYEARKSDPDWAWLYRLLAEAEEVRKNPPLLPRRDPYADIMQPLPLPVGESLPKRVPGVSAPSQPYSPGFLVTGQVSAGGDAMEGFTPMPFSEQALANVEQRAEEAEAAHEAASKADLKRWAPGQDLADEKAEEALENLLDHHDTDPAGEPAPDETAVLPAADDETA